MRYKEFLLDLIETKMRLRKSNIRMKKLDMLRSEDKDMHFEVKKQLVEKKIESMGCYFSKECNLSNPYSQLKTLCKQLKENENKIRASQVPSPTNNSPRPSARFDKAAEEQQNA